MIEKSAADILSHFNDICEKNILLIFDKRVLNCHLLFFMLQTKNVLQIYTDLDRDELARLVRRVANVYNIPDPSIYIEEKVRIISELPDEVLTSGLVLLDFSRLDITYMLENMPDVDAIYCDEKRKHLYSGISNVEASSLIFSIDIPMVVGPTCSRKIGDIYSDLFYSLSFDMKYEKVNIAPVDQLMHVLVDVIKQKPKIEKISFDLTYRPSIQEFYAYADKYFKSGERLPEFKNVEILTDVSHGGEKPGGISNSDLELSFLFENLRLTEAEQIESKGRFKESTLKTFDGVELLVYDTQDQNLPALVCINAFAMPVDLFKPLAAALSGKYRLITWVSRDVPAVTSCDYDSVSVEKQVADLGTVVSSLQLEKTNLIGWCVGAQVAMEYASQNKGLIASLILLNGVYAYQDMPETAWQENLLSMAKYASKSKKSAELSCGLMYSSAKSSEPDQKNIYADVTNSSDIALGRYVSQPFRNAESLYRYSLFISRSGSRDNFVKWTDLPEKIFLISGLKDEVAAAGAARLMKDKITHSVLQEFDDGDHYSFYFEPDKYAGAIIEFLNVS